MEVGQIIGSTTLRGFRFVIKKGMNEHVKRDEFIIVKESVTDNEILGVIKDIMISNELLPDEFGRDLRLGEIILNEGEFPVAAVKILGYEYENGLEIPRHGIQPGSPVRLADDKILIRILSQSEEKAAFMGTLATRSSVPVHISINELISKHCAVLAMTGAGKSYTVGVLIEELMGKKGAVVVFDPHGEYRDMEFEDSEVRVYGLEGKNRIRIESSSLRTGDFMNLIPDLTDTQRDLLDEILNLAGKFYDRYDLNSIRNILDSLYELKKEEKNKKENFGVFSEDILKGMGKKVGITTIGALMRRISRLQRTNLFEIEGTPFSEIVKKNQVTIIDLSDADERMSESIITAISKGIFARRKSYVKDGNGEVIDTPVFLIIEEAHNFAPRGMDDRIVLSRGILRRIAREGRKFGIGLCIVSQRPNKLDSDVLSQCNTQIIMKIVNPSDQEYIRQSVETVTEDVVRDLPSLGRGEAIIVGSAIRLTVPVKIRKRVTKAGGEDIDIVGEWNTSKS